MLAKLAFQSGEHFPTRWALHRRFHLFKNDAAQPYFIVWDLSRYGPACFDADGVWNTGGPYNPVSVAQYALYCYERLLNGDRAMHERFLVQARYLRSTQTRDGAFLYHEAKPSYRLAPPFISGMAQGEGASVLMRAYVLTSEHSYLDAARHALEPLKRCIGDGGASFIRGDAVFFEEMPCEEPVHILNGHLFAAFGIYEMCRFGFGDDELRRLNDRATRTLIRWLPLYDADGWSYYQLGVNGRGVRYYAPNSYHHYHIAQLYVLASMTGSSEVTAYARRWLAGLNRPAVRSRMWLDGALFFFDAARRSVKHVRNVWWPITVPTSL